jgi:hypothetical protein
MASSKSASRKGQSKSRSNSSGSQAAASRSARSADGMSRSASSPSSGGSSRSKSSASGPVAKALETGDSITTAARRAKGPMLAAGATAAGLAAGLALGSRTSSKRRGVGALLAPQRKVLGVPVGARKSAVVRTTKALGKVARELSLATSYVSAATDEVRQVREQLDKANRQSPLEVVLDGLTHRRGAHKRES